MEEKAKVIQELLRSIKSLQFRFLQDENVETEYLTLTSCLVQELWEVYGERKTDS